MKLVIDASVALPWFFADEKNGASDIILTEVYRDGAMVPALWPIEMGNALTMGLRRRRITDPDYFKSIAALAEIPVTVEPLDPKRALANVPPLATKHGLTFYDAMYLELAMRLSVSLATFDAEIIRAARAVGVPLWNA